MKTEKTIAIEAVAEEDVPGLYGLLSASGLPLDGLDGHLSAALVAKEDGQIVGSAALEIYGESALLRSVAVAQPLRGTGLGRQLVEATLEAARSRQIQRLYLLTETAAEWFPRFGFVPIERIAVEPAVQQSVEFTAACPTSAQAMKKEL
ncbi:MAG: GNAT family N-acetyltransferase [Caldilineaceae bacterium]|nr:GNAT family N-acetyltransferase [Caldilineaceae bacterium]HRJ43254.1 arsenic resistance N-acetyltransferase ArsN2 [Caldilineaceae bacterium]